MSSSKSEKTAAPAPAVSVWSRDLGNLPGLTPRALLLGFGIGLLCCLISYYTIYVSGADLVYFIPLPVFLFFEILIRKVSPTSRLRMQEWVIFWTIYSVMILMALTEEHGVLQETAIFAIWRFESSSPYLNLVPKVWGPADPDILTTYWYGAPVDWGIWLVPTLYWTFVAVFSYLCVMWIMLVFTKLWIDIEDLPFPQMIVNYEPLLMHEGKVRGYLWSFKGHAKWFWIGTLIGTIVGAPRVIQWMVKWPESLAWWSSIGWYGVPLGPFSLNANSIMVWGILWVCAFAPLDTLMTFAIFDFIFRVIWPNVGTALGLLPAGAHFIWGVCTRPILPYGLMIDTVGFGGWVIGTGLFFLVVSWRRILETLKYAISGTHEENEPFPWRWAWVLFIIAVIGSISLWAAAGIPLPVAILMQLYLLVVWVFNARFTAEVATWINPQMVGDRMLLDAGAAMGYWGRPEVNAASFATSMSWAEWVHTFRSPPFTQGLQSYLKVGKVTNTPYKPITYAWFAAVIFISIVGNFVYRILTCSFGVARYSEVRGYFSGWHGWSVGSAMGGLTHSTIDLYGFNPYPWALGGFIACAALYTIRWLYPWFPITPMGVWLGMAPHGGKDWRLMLWIGFIAKALTLKIGGARAYENYYVPFFVGLAVGWGLCQFALIPVTLIVRALTPT